MKRAFWLSVTIATAVTTAGCIFGLFTPKWIALAFTDNPELISVTVNSLEISMLAFWAVGFQIVSTTLTQSIGMAGKSIFLSLIRQVIFLIPLLINTSQDYGPRRCMGFVSYIRCLCNGSDSSNGNMATATHGTANMRLSQWNKQRLCVIRFIVDTGTPIYCSSAGFISL